MKDVPASIREKKKIVDYVNKEYKGHTGYIEIALSIAEYDVFAACRYLKYLKQFDDQNLPKCSRPNGIYGVTQQQIEC